MHAYNNFQLLFTYVRNLLIIRQKVRVVLGRNSKRESCLGWYSKQLSLLGRLVLTNFEVWVKEKANGSKLLPKYFNFCMKIVDKNKQPQSGPTEKLQERKLLRMIIWTTLPLGPTCLDEVWTWSLMEFNMIILIINYFYQYYQFIQYMKWGLCK